MLTEMSTASQELLKTFEHLPESEKREVASEIIRRTLRSVAKVRSTMHSYMRFTQSSLMKTAVSRKKAWRTTKRVWLERILDDRHPRRHLARRSQPHTRL